MYPQRDVSKLNTKHPQYNKGQTLKQKYAARLNWVIFQIKGHGSNFILPLREADYTFRLMEGKSMEFREAHAEIIAAGDELQKAIDKLEKKINDLYDIPPERRTR